MPKGSVSDSSSDSRGRGLMRGHFAGVRAAVFCAAVLTGLVVVGSAFAVTVTNYSPNSGLPNKAGACPGGTITLTGTGFAYDGASSALKVSFGGGPNALDFLRSRPTCCLRARTGLDGEPKPNTNPKRAGQDESQGDGSAGRHATLPDSQSQVAA